MKSKAYQSIDEFILLDKLNSGGMGEVWLAKSKGAFNVSRFVAIKMTLNNQKEIEKAEQMFMDEAKLAINLQHNNIVSVYDFKVKKGKFYLVMEYVHGISLAQMLAKRVNSNQPRLALPIVAFIIREIALGLDYAHHCIDRSSQKPLQLIHRDISPQNILISYEGNVKIIDFGIAKSKDKRDQTGPGVIKGNCSYMSPEQAKGQPDLDCTTDLFSLGIILWELIANDRLYFTGDLYATLKNAREANIPDIGKINPAIPEEIIRIIRKSLSLDRNSRYRLGRDLAKDLTSFLSREFPSLTQNDLAIFMKSSFAEEEREISEKIKAYTEVINSGLNVWVEENDENQNNFGRFENPTGFSDLVASDQDSKSQSGDETNVLLDKFSIGGDSTNPSIDLKSLLVGKTAFSVQKKIEPIAQVIETKPQINIFLKRAGQLLFKSMSIFVVISIIFLGLFFLAPKQHAKIIELLRLDKISAHDDWTQPNYGK